jgi:hypothetical protein
MNIFVLDIDPSIAASYHCDKHVVKMILESIQMIKTNLYLDGRIGKEAYVSPGFKNHPCTKWARMSYENEDWLRSLTFSLFIEYTLRYEKEHKSLYEFMSLPNIDRPSIGLSDFAQAMPDYCKDRCAVTAYRNYYLNEKRRFVKWRLGKPYWWFD